MTALIRPWMVFIDLYGDNVICFVSMQSSRSALLLRARTGEMPICGHLYCMLSLEKRCFGAPFFLLE